MNERDTCDPAFFHLWMSVARAALCSQLRATCATHVCHCFLQSPTLHPYPFGGNVQGRHDPRKIMSRCLQHSIPSACRMILSVHVIFSSRILAQDRVFLHLCNGGRYHCAYLGMSLSYQRASESSLNRQFALQSSRSLTCASRLLEQILLRAPGSFPIKHRGYTIMQPQYTQIVRE